MAASLNDWIHASLLTYSDKHSSDLSVVVKGQRMQILKWHTYNEPYWAEIGDSAHSIFARFTSDAVEAYWEEMGRRVTELKTGIIHVKTFRLEMVSPYKNNPQRELALVVTEFKQFGMGDDEIHYEHTRQPLKNCGGQLGEWIQKLRTAQSALPIGSSLSLQAQPSMEVAEPTTADIGDEATPEARPAPQPTVVEPRHAFDSVKDASDRFLGLGAYAGSKLWVLSRKELARQDEQPDTLADGPSTEDCIARDLAALEAAKLKQISPPTPPGGAGPSKRAISPASSSDEEDDLPIKKPRRALTKSSPVPTSSPPLGRPVNEPASQTKSPPSSARTATYSSPPSQQRPVRVSRSESGLLDGKAKNALGPGGSRVYVDGSDEEDERAQEKEDEAVVKSSLDDDEPKITPGQRSRMKSPSTQPVESPKSDHEDEVDAERMDVDETDAIGEPAGTDASETPLQASAPSETTTSELDRWALSPPDAAAANDGRRVRPGFMMLKTGKPDSSYSEDSALMQMQSAETDTTRSTASATGGVASGEQDVPSSGRQIDSSDQRRGFRVGSHLVEDRVDQSAAAEDDEPAEAEAEDEEVARSVRSSPGASELVSRVARGTDESESLSLDKDDPAHSHPGGSVVKEEAASQALARSSHAEDEAESQDDVDEVGGLTQLDEHSTSSTRGRTDSGSRSPSRPLEPMSLPNMKPSPTSPREREPPLRPTTERPSETPERPRVPRAQGPPPSSGAFHLPQSPLAASSSAAVHETSSEVTNTPPRPPKRVRSPTASSPPPASLKAKAATPVAGSPPANKPAKISSPRTDRRATATTSPVAKAAVRSSPVASSSTSRPARPPAAGTPPRSSPATHSISPAPKAEPRTPAVPPLAARLASSHPPSSDTKPTNPAPGPTPDRSRPARDSRPPTPVVTTEGPVMYDPSLDPLGKKPKRARKSLATQAKNRLSLGSDQGSARSESPAVGAPRMSNASERETASPFSVSDARARLERKQAAARRELEAQQARELEELDRSSEAPSRSASVAESSTEHRREDMDVDEQVARVLDEEDAQAAEQEVVAPKQKKHKAVVSTTDADDATSPAPSTHVRPTELAIATASASRVPPAASPSSESGSGRKRKADLFADADDSAPPPARQPQPASKARASDSKSSPRPPLKPTSTSAVATTTTATAAVLDTFKHPIPFSRPPALLPPPPPAVAAGPSRPSPSPASSTKPIPAPAAPVPVPAGVQSLAFAQADDIPAPTAVAQGPGKIKEQNAKAKVASGPAPTVEQMQTWTLWKGGRTGTGGGGAGEPTMGDVQEVLRRIGGGS